MPSLTRKPPAFPSGEVVVVAGFAADVPGYGPFVPRVGSRWRVTHEPIAYLLKHGGSKLFLDAGGDDGDLLAAQGAAMAAVLDRENLERDPAVATGVLLNPTNSVTCTSPIFRNEAGGGRTQIAAPGMVFHVSAPLAKKYPESFRPAEPGDFPTLA